MNEAPHCELCPYRQNEEKHADGDHWWEWWCYEDASGRLIELNDGDTRPEWCPIEAVE